MAKKEWDDIRIQMWEKNHPSKETLIEVFKEKNLLYKLVNYIMLVIMLLENGLNIIIYHVIKMILKNYLICNR